MSCCDILNGISHKRYHSWFYEAYIKHHFLKDFRNDFFPGRIALPQIKALEIRSVRHRQKIAPGERKTEQI